VKTLVVYYSRSGNTKKVAGMIARQLGADLEELVDLKGRAGLLGWLRAGRDAMKDRTTDLGPLGHDPGDYDVIVVGSPVWAAHPAPAVNTFLNSQDLSGKQVALFCTMAGNGGEETCANMKSILRGAEVAEPLIVTMRKRTEAEIDKQVTRWAARWQGGE
jgi:flavodoxin